MTVTDALQELRLNPRFAGHITSYHRLPARIGKRVPLPAGLDPRLETALRRRGLDALYEHQSTAIAAALKGEDVAVVTGPASGKTLCYNLPVLNSLLLDPLAHALYLFPTKALAQDQLASWQELSAGLLAPVEAATYDGDTPPAARARVRREARLLITNPDMLHVGLLPHHTRWQALFGNLRYVVLDEMHTYRGLLGSHVANVLRRLIRVCELYGARPQFVCCSATIANPSGLASQLLGRPVTVVDNDTAPRGERHFVFYNPPLVDLARGLRRGLIVESAALADFFLLRNLSTIVFCPGRRGTELLLTYLRGALGQKGRSASQVRGYRGGYLPRERRSIERGLRDGSVRGVVSTNALELGVDIGDLSVCILSGYPGTIASTWQQAGRAGRRQDASATVLVGGPSPLDQYLLTHPQYLLGHTPEAALIAPDNPFVLRSHLECAAFEYPFREGEGFSPAVDTSAALAEIGAQDDVLHRSGKRWYWMSSRYPAQDVSLRTAGNERFSIVSADSGETVGEVDSSSAPQLVHPGAVYLHEGATYLVEELDWPARVASVRHVDADYFTQASVSAKVQVLQVRDSLAGLPASRGWGDVQVNTRATGYSRLAWFSHEKLETLPLDLPELELITTAYWLHLGAEIVTALQDQGDWTIAALRSYGPNWAEQRRKARQRDRFRCRNCGRPETSERQLDVHHLSPFRTFDYRPGQNDNYIQANHLDNLVSLCHDCHRRLETAREMLGTLEGMANLLKSIAPLFLMCDSRDLGVVADLDMGFTGGPTVVLYDAVPGGVGFSEALFGLHDTILGTCRDWVDKCACQEGCPACVGAPVETGLGAKRRVRTLLDALVG